MQMKNKPVTQKNFTYTEAESAKLQAVREKVIFDARGEDVVEWLVKSSWDLMTPLSNQKPTSAELTHIERCLIAFHFYSLDSYGIFHNLELISEKSQYMDFYKVPVLRSTLSVKQRLLLDKMAEDVNDYIKSRIMPCAKKHHKNAAKV